jgi:RsiW-degrading membrane proteinase PrsW (M82 family)
MSLDAKEIPMPPLLSKPSGAAPATLFYVTVGAMMTVWSGIWFMYLRNNPPSHPFVNYVCFGFLITGIVLLMIGFTLGPLSRWARHAELPPTEATGPAIQTEQTAAATRRTA